MNIWYLEYIKNDSFVHKRLPLQFEWEQEACTEKGRFYDEHSTDEETKEIEKSQRRTKMDQALKTRKDKLQLLEKYTKVYGREEAVEMVKKLADLSEKRAKGREETVAMLERQREQRGRPPPTMVLLPM